MYVYGACFVTRGNLRSMGFPVELLISIARRRSSGADAALCNKHKKGQTARTERERHSDGKVLDPVKLQGQTSIKCMFFLSRLLGLFHNIVASLVASLLLPRCLLIKENLFHVSAFFFNVLS